MAITLSFPAGGALVVGGTGNVGRGVVRRLAAADVPLVFTYRGGPGRGSDERSALLERELRDKGHDVTRMQLDMSDQSAIDAAIDAVVSKTGRLHSVLCAAGPPVPFNTMMDFEPDEVERFFRDDIFAYFRLYRSAVHVMRQSGGGSLIGTTTMANAWVVDTDGVVAASKAAVDSLTRQIAAEESIYGIRANTVGIGVVIEQTVEQMEARLQPAEAIPPRSSGQVMLQIMSRMRLRRFGHPDDAGNLYAFLASDQAVHITGQMFLFDGGISL